MKLLVIGKTGQIGWELRRVLAAFGNVIAPGREALELARPDSIRACLREWAPQVIVNAAAYTAVDRAEEEPERAQAINGAAPGVLAEETRRLGGLLVHYSSDYVFDGARPDPYTEEDPPCPLSAYGRSKLAGEEAIRAVAANHLILRTSWVYGLRGHNFLRTILRLMRERESLTVVADQVGAPTWSRMIAEATGQILAQLVAPRHAGGWGGLTGLYHFTAAGAASWFDFARAIAELDPDKGRHVVQAIRPLTTEQYPTAAKRPRNSRLSCRAVQRDFGLEPADWKEALRMVMEERAPEGR